MPTVTIEETEENTPVFDADKITSGDLESSGEISITSPPPSTSTDGLIGELEKFAEQTVPQETVDTGRETTRQSLETVTDFLGTAETPSELESRFFKREGVDDLTKEVADLNGQLLREQHGLNRRLQALDKNPEGLFGGGLRAEKQRITDESLERQADLSIIMLGKQGKLDAARDIANRKVQARLERQELELEALQFTYEENKELFTKDEQRRFEAVQFAREKTLDLKETEMNNINDLALTALENGAPTSVVKQIFASGDIEGAMTAAAPYLKKQTTNKVVQRGAELKLAADYAAQRLEEDPFISLDQLRNEIRADAEFLNETDIDSAIRQAQRTEGVLGATQFIDEDWIRENFDESGLFSKAKEKGFFTGLFASKDKAVKAYIDSVLSDVQELRARRKTDEEIDKELFGG